MLSFIRRWFSSLLQEDLRPATEAPPQALADAQAETRAAEPPAAEAENDVEAPLEGWWTPQGEPVLTEPVQIVADFNRGLYEQLVKVLNDANLEIPRMPQVAHRALLALRDDNANYKEIAGLVGQDPALAAEVLRVTNSVAYRAIREIRSLELAFARLGVRTLRSIILGATVKGLAIRVGGAERTTGEELWRRSLASGVILRTIGPRWGVPEDEAFLVGLLHDVGLLLALKVVHEYQQYHGRAVGRPIFDRICREWHEQLGNRLAENWNLPEPLPQLIGDHHSAVSADDPLATQRHLVRLADSACAMLGYAPYVPYDFFALPCAKALDLRNTPRNRLLLSELQEQLQRSVNATA